MGKLIIFVENVDVLLLPITSSVPIVNTITQVESTTKNKRPSKNRSEFITSMVMGLSVSFSIGLAGIFLVLLYH